jgi:hypothetical protein
MILRHDGAVLTLPLIEVELSKEALDASVVGPRPAAWAMVGHRPVLHCDSGLSTLPPVERSYPSWQLDELLEIKVVGA